MKGIDSIEPVVPGAEFLQPTADFLDNERLHSWFPSPNPKEEFFDLTITKLPFNKDAFIGFCQGLLQLPAEVINSANMPSENEENLEPDDTLLVVDSSTAHAPDNIEIMADSSTNQLENVVTDPSASAMPLLQETETVNNIDENLQRAIFNSVTQPENQTFIEEPDVPLEENVEDTDDEKK